MDGRLAGFGRRVHAVVNYDNVELGPAAEDIFFAMIRDSTEKYFLPHQPAAQGKSLPITHGALGDAVMSSVSLSRRDVLKVSALGAAAVALPFEQTVRAKSASRIAASLLPKPYVAPFVVPPVAQPKGTTKGLDGVTDVPLYDITQKEGLAQILPTIKTPIFGYDGIAPGPTILARKGRPIAVKVTNALPAKHPQWGYEAWTSVHLHGSASKPQYDGYASDITRPGEYKIYHYPNSQDARMLWYHDHGVHHTAENAYMGLAAVYLLGDEVEDRLPIPKGALRPAAGHHRQDVRRRRQVHVRRRGPLRPLRRRDPGQRRSPGRP